MDCMEERQEIVKVDRQGRLVLPSRIRKSLGLESGGMVSIKRDGSRVVLEPKPASDLEKRVARWEKVTLEMEVNMFSEPTLRKAENVNDGLRWMSREYARRKLGLH